MLKKLFKDRFWLFVYLDTLAIGIALICFDFIYDDRLPYLMQSFLPPYLGFIMLAAGIFSMIEILFKGPTKFSIVVHSMIWSFICVGSILDLVTPDHTYTGTSLILGILSLLFSIKILVEATAVRIKE